MTLPVIFSILACHWFGDFFCQSDIMAQEKSKDNRWLGIHVMIYTLVFAFFLPVILNGIFKLSVFNWLPFVIWTFILHFLQDYWTSRLNSWLYTGGHRHWFFVAIGFDQLLHYVALFTTFQLCKL